MVAIFSGLGPGAERGSATEVGIAGNAAQGRGGDAVSLNIANGNLLISRQDDFLVGRGLDIRISRTYNSQGALDENGDHWRQSTDLRVFNHLGPFNTAGSTVVRVSADGSEITYTYQTRVGVTAYWATDGGGAHDRMTMSGGVWTRTDGDSQTVESYVAYGTNNWRITTKTDINDHSLTYEYSGANLSKLITDDGAYLKYTWSGTNITSIETYANGGATKTLTRTRYGYDASNRLTSVTTDLSPEDNAIGDGYKYVTTYTYHGASKRVHTITQTDGSVLELNYDGSSRVTSVKQTVASGDVRLTTITYNSATQTTIADANGTQTILTHDGDGHLTQTKVMNPSAGVANQTVSYAYDGDDNITQITDSENNVVQYSYDAMGNRTSAVNASGRTSYFVYDSNNNLTRTQTETSYEGGSNTWAYTRNVYDSVGRLRYTIDPEGRVKEYRYQVSNNSTWGNKGDLRTVHKYSDHTYAIGSSAPTEAQMDSWRNGLTDFSGNKIFEYRYNAKSELIETVNWSGVNTNGTLDGAEGFTHTIYTMDTAGRVLTKRLNGLATETFAYDGLGRLISSTDLNGGSTTISFNDAATKTTVSTSAGYTVVSTYNKAGELISQLESGTWVAGDTAAYQYDKDGNLRISTDATGYKTYYLYDNLGRVTAEINQYGHLAEYRYDRNGQVIATARFTNAISSSNLAALGASPDSTLTVDEIRPGAHVYDIWEWTAYDAQGRVSRSALGDGSVTIYVYDYSSNITATRSYYNKLSTTQISDLKNGSATLESYLPSANGNDTIIRTFYDLSGRIIGSLNGEGFLSQIIYDGSGNKVEEVTFSSAASSTHWASGTFNQLYNSISKNASKDIRVRYVYDGQNFLRFTIDAESHVTQYVYKSAAPSSNIGAVRSTIQHYTPLATLSSYSYEAVQAAVAALDSAGSNRTSWNVYNARNQLIYSINAEGEVARVFYDTAGQITKAVQYAVRRTTASLPSEGDMNTWASANSANSRTSWNYYTARGEKRFDIDAEGYVRQFEYDAEGRLTREILWSNALTPVDGWTTSTVNNIGKGSWVDTKYNYNAWGLISTIIDANGVVRSFSYYGNKTKARETRAYGSGRDESHVLYVNDAAGRTFRELHYSSDVATGKRNDFRYYYDGLGNLVRTQATRDSHDYATPDQNTYYTHDKNGQVLTQTNAENGVTTYQYDAFGNAVKVTDPLNNATYAYYDQMGRVVTQVDAENYVTKNTYTAFGELFQSTRYHNTATGVGNVNTLPTVSGSSVTTTFHYDRVGRAVQVKDARNYSDYTLYNAFGQVVETTNKLGGETSYTYDNRGLLVSEQTDRLVYNSAGTLLASSVTSTHTYDSRGNRTQTVEAAGLSEARTTTYVYDAVDRLVQKKGESVGVYSDSVDNSSANVTPKETYTYDARGNLIESTNALGARTLYFYDAMDRVTHTVSPTGTLTRNFYDANSNLMEVRVYGIALDLSADFQAYVDSYPDLSAAWGTGPSAVANGTNHWFAHGYKEGRILPNSLQTAPAGSGAYRRTTFVYDKLNRMTQSTVHDVQTAEFGTSLAITGTGNDLVTSYEYDTMGNVIKQTDPNGNQFFSYYDNVGRKTHQVDQEGYLTEWTYNAMGQVTRERNWWNKPAVPSIGTIPVVGSNGTNDRITDYTYDAAGNRLTEKRLNVKIYNGSGGETTVHSLVQYQYNALGQVTRKTEATGDYIDYIYDAYGRVTTEKRQGYVSHTGATVTPQVNYHYNGHDDMARIWQAGAAGIGAKATMYDYDAAGRLASMTDTAGFTKTYRYDQAGRLMREEYIRATATLGNKTEGVGYTYDIESRVTEQAIVSWNGSAWIKGDTTNTTYNAFGDVAARGINGASDEYFEYDNAGRVWRTNSGDGVFKYFMYDNNGNQTLVMTSDGTNINNKTITQMLAYWSVSASGGSANNISTNYVDGVVATITKYDARNLATEVREPERQINASTRHDLITQRGYTAFGEVSYEIDANNARIDYTYNTMGMRTMVQSPSVVVVAANGKVEATLGDGGTVTYDAANPANNPKVRPVEKYYFDESGRLEASRDANNNLTRQTLLAGTGYGGSQALITSTTSPDQGVVSIKYDIHGNVRRKYDQLNQSGSAGALYTSLDYDGMGRVTKITHVDPDGSGGTEQALIEQFRYDGFGQQIRHWNNGVGVYSETGSTIEQTTDFDASGRVIKQIAFGGDETSYTYNFIANMNTGLGAYGGWEKVTTYEAMLNATTHRTSIDRTDVFGRVEKARNMSNVWTYHSYDTAGRLIGTEVGNIEHDFVYYNTGKLKMQTRASFNDIGYTIPQQVANFTYDDLGRTLTEVQTYGSYTVKNQTTTYDALSRIVSWNEAGGSVKNAFDNTQWGGQVHTIPAAHIDYKYDANGNIRNTYSTFGILKNDGEPTGVTRTENYWYTFDSMNRVVISKGWLSGNQIVTSTSGTLSSFDAAGNRTTATSTKYISGGYYDDESASWISYSENAAYEETYTYDKANRLSSIYVYEESVEIEEGVGHYLYADEATRAVFDYDTLGRLEHQYDYQINGNTIAFQRDLTYDTSGRVQSDTTNTKRGANIYKAVTTNNYGTGTDYAMGAVSIATTINYKDGNNGNADDTRVYNSYLWFNGAVQGKTVLDPKYLVGQSSDQQTVSAVMANPGLVHSSPKYTNFAYEADGSLRLAATQDSRARTIYYTNDLTGAALYRNEVNGYTSVGDPVGIYYRFAGRDMGNLINSGITTRDNYAESIGDRTVTGGNGPFHNGATSATSQGSFAVGPPAITSYFTGSGGGTYTSQQPGETLSSIASQLWGDASLWYKIAEANGLGGDISLDAGQTLRLPTGVLRNTHSAGTFAPFDPASALGDVAPGAPDPSPKNGKNCGVMGAVLLSVVAVAVGVITQQWWASAELMKAGLTSTVVGGAVGGAAGSIASQAVGVATGIQDKFSWNDVGLAAISGGVGGGPADNIAQAILQGAVSSAITQGIGVATGLQDKFSWAGVAAAGISAGVGKYTKSRLGGYFGDHGLGNKASVIASQVTVSTASSIASAATRTAFDGGSFASNLKASIPDIIGQAIGSAITMSMPTPDQQVSQNPTSETEASSAGNTSDDEYTNDLKPLFDEYDEQGRALSSAQGNWIEARQNANALYLNKVVVEGLGDKVRILNSLTAQTEQARTLREARLQAGRDERASREYQRQYGIFGNAGMAEDARIGQANYQRNEDANAYGKAKWWGSPESQTTTLTAGLKHLDEIQDQILRQRGQIAAAQESVVEMLAYGAGPVGAAANGVIMATDFMENGLTLSNTANVLMSAVHAKQFSSLFKTCFVAGTPVLTETGTKPIENIQVGDKVWSLSEFDSGAYAWRTVLNKSSFDEKEIWSVSVSAPDGRGETILATGNHPFWVEYVDGDEDTGGWTAVEYLKPGDTLRLADGSAAFVTDVRDTGQSDTVYNFEVDGYHTYHVGQLGLWVHNANCGKLVRIGGETARTEEGRRAHDIYSAFAEAEGLLTKGGATLPSGRIPDAIDSVNRIVRELKPDTPSGIRTGKRQVARYVKELERITGETWTGLVDTYRPFGK